MRKHGMQWNVAIRCFGFCFAVLTLCPTLSTFPACRGRCVELRANAPEQSVKRPVVNLDAFLHPVLADSLRRLSEGQGPLDFGKKKAQKGCFCTRWLGGKFLQPVAGELLFRP